jgi:hypothetical protein
MNPQQRRQFIPQGAIKFVGIVFAFLCIVAVMTFMLYSVFSPTASLRREGTEAPGG